MAELAVVNQIKLTTFFLSFDRLDGWGGSGTVFTTFWFQDSHSQRGYECASVTEAAARIRQAVRHRKTERSQEARASNAHRVKTVPEPPHRGGQKSSA